MIGTAVVFVVQSVAMGFFIGGVAKQPGSSVDPERWILLLFPGCLIIIILVPAIVLGVLSWRQLIQMEGTNLDPDKWKDF